MSTDLDSVMLKAKIELMTRSVFISTIALSVKHIINETVDTAATNGTSIWYNPQFITGMSVQKLAGLMAHEVWHIAFQHGSRRGSRDHRIWNAAGDYVINYMLTQGGFEIPDGGLLDSKYADMSTDEVYDLLIQDHSETPNLEDLMMDILEPGEGEEDSLTADQKTQVIDILVKAHTQAKISGEKEVGKIPGEILRVIDELINPKLPWPLLLNRFLDVTIKEEYSWARRNRRHSTYMPSLHSYGLGHLTWAIDLSGSITDEELKEILSEIQGVQRTLCPEKMTIVGCDSKICNVHEIDSHTDILSLEFTGGGGTAFHEVMDYVKEHPTAALIYFTDLYAAVPTDPGIPVMWICNSNHKKMPFGETIYI